MEKLVQQFKEAMPGCGFALIAFDIQNGSGVGNYISNVKDDYMIKALEHQLVELKARIKLRDSL